MHGNSPSRKEPIIRLTLCSDNDTFNVTFIRIPTSRFVISQADCDEYDNSSKEMNIDLNRNNGRNADGTFGPGNPKGARHKET